MAMDAQDGQQVLAGIFGSPFSGFRKHRDGAWSLSSSSDRHALSMIDGTGWFSSRGTHYSRRTPGSKTFTGVGKEVVLVTESAVWAVVEQRTPARAGSGQSRGRNGRHELTPTVWRNLLFRNLGSFLSSSLIRTATVLTYLHWLRRYGELPRVRLRTEVDIRHASSNPGYCYQCAGWSKGETKGHKLFLYAPPLEVQQNVAS